METNETTSAPSTMPAMEQTGLQLEFTSGPVSIPATSLAPAITGLQLIISSKSPILVVDPDPMITSPISLLPSMLVENHLEGG